MRIIPQLICIFFFTGALSSLSAEDRDSFFDKKFDVQPGSDDIDSPKQKKPAPRKATAIPLPTPDKQRETLKEQVQNIAASARQTRSFSRGRLTPTVVPPSGKQTMKVVEVSGVLSGVDQTQLAQLIEDMVSVVDGKEMMISIIYVVGSESPTSIKLEYEVAKKGGRINYVKELPEKYKMIKQAPTWILAATNQEIIIEGAGMLSENLSARGAIITQATEKVPLAEATKK